MVVLPSSIQLGKLEDKIENGCRNLIWIDVIMLDVIGLDGFIDWIRWILGK